jgi:AraC-like DNA-binding protein
LWFYENYDETDEKINKVYEYTINNFREDISLKKIASIAYLSCSSFCRYFKNKTSKTYSRFLAEVRIGYACKLLLQEKLNISEICYECGYKNLSNFNRHLRK